MSGENLLLVRMEADWSSDYQVRWEKMDKGCGPAKSRMKDEEFKKLIAILRRSSIEAPETWGLWLKEKQGKRGQEFNRA